MTLFQVAAKLVALKTIFPKATAFKIVSKTPKLLLKATSDVVADGERVRQILAPLEDPDAVIESVPELIDPRALLRALTTIQASFPSQDPLQVGNPIPVPSQVMMRHPSVTCRSHRSCRRIQRSSSP